VIYSSEAWPMKVDHDVRLDRNEMNVIRF